MNSINVLVTPTGVAVLLVVLAGVARTLAQGRPASPERQADKALELKVPEALRLHHAAFQAEFSRATKEKGKVGEAARALEKLPNAHFAKAKEAFPPLALLPLLSEEVSPEMRKVVPMRTTLNFFPPEGDREICSEKKPDGPVAPEHHEGT